MKFLLATIFFGAQAKIALATSNEYQDLTKEDSLIVAEDQKIQDISVVDKATVHEKTNDIDIEFTETVERIKTNEETEEYMHTEAYEYTYALGGIKLKYKTRFEEDGIVISPVIISQESKDVQVNEDEEGLALTAPEEILAHYEEIKENNEVTPAVGSKTDVGGNDHLKIVTSPTPDETNDEFGCSVCSDENACAKVVDAKTGAKCQWHTDTTTGVEACLPEKVEIVNTGEVGGVEYKHKLTFEGNTITWNMITPREELFAQMSDNHGIANVVDEKKDVKEIPKFSPNLRGAMIQ